MEAELVDVSRPLRCRVAVVTGATSGIGRAVAVDLGRAGADVAVLHMDDDDSATSVRDAVSSTGSRCVTVRCDVTVGTDVEAAVALVTSEIGPPEILVNNAGAYPRTTWWETSADQFRQMVDVNLTSQFLCAQACTPAMRDRGYGKIVNVGSNLAFAGRSELVGYIAAKSGVVGLTRALARELGVEGIRANCLVLGAIVVDTERDVVPDPEAAHARLMGRQCLQYRGTVNDVVGAFRFFASPASDFITGQTLVIDGGWVLG